MFRASLCPSSGEQRPCYRIWRVVLVLLDVVVSGCGALSCRMYFVLLPPASAPIATVTWLRVGEVACSILGSELVIVFENIVCMYVLVDIVDQY